MIGKIKTVTERHFGFIGAEDGNEYFFHRSGLVEVLAYSDLSVGMTVEFEVVPSDRGPRAANVRLPSTAPAAS